MASIGKGKNGEWLTTSLKEYPGNLCKLLADLFLESQRDCGGGETLPAWFTERCDTLIGTFDHEAGMGLDYHRKKLFESN